MSWGIFFAYQRSLIISGRPVHNYEGEPHSKRLEFEAQNRKGTERGLVFHVH